MKISTKLAKGICKFLAVAGFILVVGTVGGLEQDTMSFLTALLYFLVDFIIIVVSLVGYAFVEAVEDDLIEEREMRRKIRQEKIKAAREREARKQALRNQRFREIAANTDIRKIS